MTVLLIIVAVVLAPVAVIFIWGFVKGFREHRTPPPSPDELRTLWYDIVWGQKPKPKPRRRFRVVFPPPKDEDSSSR